jgi:hypothetical protein
VTDPGYPAKGRRYGDEDVLLAGRLRASFEVATAHPNEAAAAIDQADVVLVRNSGPVLGHLEAWEAFKARAAAVDVPVVNPLHGKGDQAGKGYLVEMTAAGMPVIPTVDSFAELARLGAAERFVVKPKAGADSLGQEVLTDLAGVELGELVAQPFVPFVHEESYVFVGRSFVYAVRTLDEARRWQLEPWRPSHDDVAWAQVFVDWNGLDVGVTRVDACRLPDGSLLLVELEDLNPYLSLEVLDGPTLDAFVAALVQDLRTAIEEA